MHINAPFLNFNIKNYFFNKDLLKLSSEIFNECSNNPLDINIFLLNKNSFKTTSGFFIDFAKMLKQAPILEKC